MDNMNGQQFNSGESPQDGQNQSVSPQQGQPIPQNNIPKKKSNTGLIIGLIVGGVVLLGIITICVILFFIFIIGSRIDEYKEMSDDYIYEYEEDDSYNYDWDDDIKDTKSTDEKEYQRIGNNIVGYIDVPADYYPYEDIGATSSEYRMQYSDISGLNVITLFAYEDTTAVGLADEVFGYYSLDEEVDQDTLEGAIITINGCEAYQMYCYYPEDGIYLYTWCFETPDSNYVHYLAIESTDKNSDLFDLRETFSSVE